MFNKGAGFREIGIVAGDQKIGIEVHRIINRFDRRSRETRRRQGSDERHG